MVIATKRGIPNISIAALFENGELRLKLSLLIIILHKKITNWTSNTCRIEIVKKDIHFRGSDTATPSHLSTDAIFYANGSSYFCLGQQRNGTVFCSRVIY